MNQTPTGLVVSDVGTQNIGYTNNRNNANTYDAAGNQTNDGLHSYTFNAENQIVSMDAGTATYAYDGDGRRMKKVTSTETTYTFYGPGGIISEFTTSNILSTASFSYAGATDLTRPPGITDQAWSQIQALEQNPNLAALSVQGQPIGFLNDNFFTNGDPSGMATTIIHELLHMSGQGAEIDAQNPDGSYSNYALISEKCGTRDSSK